jgi:uncharacterized membrane protein SpoIIM required for sporulation
MIDRDAFVSTRTERWRRLNLLLLRGPQTAGEWTELSSLYRVAAADLAAARGRGLPPDVVRHLDDLASRAHNALYGARGVYRGRAFWAIVGADFPRTLRAEWRFFLLASLLFYGPFLVGGLGATLDEGFALAVLPQTQLDMVEQMYSSPDLARGAGEDSAMAGFYVRNNIGIAFRCFATGILAGLGSVFFLVYNGLVIGTTFGHLGRVGLLPNLLAFTAGHSAWELTGIVVSGAAGLRMGWALVVTKGRTRVGSLRAAAPVLFHLIMGTFALLAVAAMIEGFWSAGPMPPLGKYLFGGLQIVLVAAWLGFGGRGRP